MVLCTVDELKVHVAPESLTDEDLLDIITSVSAEITLLTGGSQDASTEASLNLACVHSSAAATLRKMRVNGELAASVKFGNQEQKNAIDADIQDHENKSARYVKMYRHSSGCSVPFGRSGPGTVNKQ